MHYTGKIVGYSIEYESAPDGTVTSLNPVDESLLKKILELQPTVTIEIEESAAEHFLGGILSALTDWSKSIWGAIFFVALLVLNSAPGMDDPVEGVKVLSLCFEVAFLSLYLFKNVDLMLHSFDNAPRWRILGHIVGFLIGWILMKLLLNSVDPLTVNGAVKIVMWYLGIRIPFIMVRVFWKQIAVWVQELKSAEKQKE